MTDDSTPRPQWECTLMSEEDFGKLVGIGRIKAVEAKMEMTGADTTIEWLEFTNYVNAKIIPPKGWSQLLEFKGKNGLKGLFSWTYKGKEVLRRYLEIQAWEQEEEQDREEYERLKRKFEGV